MSERQEDRRERYRKVRSEFDSLEIEDKALFLLEATVSTVLRGAEEFGRTMSSEIEKAFAGRSEQHSRSETGPSEPGSTTADAGPTGERDANAPGEGANGSTADEGGEKPGDGI